MSGTESTRNLLDVAKSHVPPRWRKRAIWTRAQVCESIGLRRYSRPGLYGLDTVLEPLLPDTGVFLEVGANDGFDQSNTYYLERFRGWTGLLIEPLPENFAACRRRRKRAHCVRAACVSPDYPGSTVELADQDLMTVTVGIAHAEYADRVERVDRRIHARAATLSAIIDASPFVAFDFMSIDVEGAELAVLSGLDLDRHAPNLLLVETHALGQVEDLLRPWMNLQSRLTVHDYLFARARD